MVPIWTPLKLEFGLASRLAAGSATAASFPKSRRVKVISSPLELHFPTLAIGRLDPLGGVLIVAELPLRVVPHQLAFVVNGSGAEHQPLGVWPVSYTHLRAHETRHDLVCRLLLEKTKHR